GVGGAGIALEVDDWGDGRIHGLRFEHGDVLCNGLTTNCGDRRAYLAQAAGMGLAPIARQIRLTGDDNGLWQPPWLVCWYPERGNGHLCFLIEVGSVQVRGRLHSIAPRAVACGHRPGLAGEDQRWPPVQG